MGWSRVIRVVGVVATLVATFSACTLQEWTDENVIRKAVILLDYPAHFDQVHLQLRRQGDDENYRDTVLTAVGDAPVEVTYLYNGRYEVKSLVGVGACSVASHHDGTMVVAAVPSADGCVAPVGEVLLNSFVVSIVKGDRKTFAPVMDTITTAMSVEVEGLEWVPNAEQLRFEYDYPTAMTHQGKVWSENGLVEYGTYVPTMEFDGAQMSGCWHTIYDSEIPTMTIRLTYPDGKVLYERVVSGEAQESALKLSININITFTPTHIHATVGEWTETVERVTVDFQ